MRRAAVRFALLVFAIGLLVFLILLQQSLRDGLIGAFVGAVRNQTAPVLVYSVDAQRTLQGSVVPPPLEAQLRDVENIDALARVGQGNFTVTVDGGEEADAAILGTDDPSVFRPSNLVDGRESSSPGEAVGSEVGHEVGDIVEVVPAEGSEPVTLTVVGLAADLQLSVTPTLFTDYDTYESAVRAVNPAATDVIPSVLAVTPSDGTTAEELVTTINETVPDAEALTRTDAAETSPGVAQVRQSFQIIFLLYGLVVPLVTGLFFLILTLQKASSLTLLRAIGVGAGSLARSLLIQVLIVVGLGLAVGVALYLPLTRSNVGGLALQFDTSAVLTWSAVITVLGLVIAVDSLRLVLAIDAVEAITGGTA